MRRTLNRFCELLLCAATLLVALTAHRLADRLAYPGDPAQRLHAAVYANDLPAVRRFLDQGISPDANTLGVPALQFVRDPAVARLLLQRGASPTGPYHDNAPLIAAIPTGNLELVRLLLEAGADPNQPLGPHLPTPLDTSVTFRQPAIAALLRARGARPSD